MAPAGQHHQGTSVTLLLLLLSMIVCRVYVLSNAPHARVHAQMQTGSDEAGSESCTLPSALHSAVARSECSAPARDQELCAVLTSQMSLF
jgi:hypothetical protein